jgi:Tfp pilus assembly protein PilX
VVRRKKVVVVSAPPAWKVKKEKLERAKQAAEAAARQAEPVPVKATKAPPPVRYLRLTAARAGDHDPEGVLATAVRRQLATSAGHGMREQLFADIARRDLPLSHKQVIKCLKSLTRSAGYLSRMREGASAMTCRECGGYGHC